MCDFSSIFGGGSGDSIFSGKEISALGDIFTDANDYLSNKDIAKQREKRAGQILESAKQEIGQKITVQQRNNSTRRAAYGKSGVTLKGSPATFFEEQAKQDELELLTDQYNAKLKIGDELNAARAATGKADTALSKGLVKATDFVREYDFDKIKKGFGLGA